MVGFGGFIDGVVEEVADFDGFDEHTALKGGLVRGLVELGGGKGGLTRPPPMKRTVMEMCSRSVALHSPPQPPRCSRKMLVEP